MQDFFHFFIAQALLSNTFHNCYALNEHLLSSFSVQHQVGDFYVFRFVRFCCPVYCYKRGIAICSGPAPSLSTIQADISPFSNLENIPFPRIFGPKKTPFSFKMQSL